MVTCLSVQPPDAPTVGLRREPAHSCLCTPPALTPGSSRGRHLGGGRPQASARGPGVREKHQHGGREQALCTHAARQAGRRQAVLERCAGPGWQGDHGPSHGAWKSPDGCSEPRTPSRVNAKTTPQSRPLLHQTCWREKAQVKQRRHRRLSTDRAPSHALHWSLSLGCEASRQEAPPQETTVARLPPPSSPQLQVQWTEAAFTAPFKSEGSTAPSGHVHQDLASVLTGPRAPRPPAPSAESRTDTQLGRHRPPLIQEMTQVPTRPPSAEQGAPRPHPLRARGDAPKVAGTAGGVIPPPPLSRELSQPASLNPASTPHSTVTALPDGLAGASASLLVLGSGGNARMSALRKTRTCKSVKCKHPRCMGRGLRSPRGTSLSPTRPAASNTAQKHGAPRRVYEQDLEGPPSRDPTPQARAKGQGHRGRPAAPGPGGPGCHSSLHWCRWGSPTRRLYKTILNQPHKIRYLSKLS